ncbi:MAG: hypothetical protein OXF67_03950 [Cyanobacteria bacterium MAG CAR4_bin_6]|nr:hypothetical protein [Cyanobacteria bacterium MAG CAR4_bin_6]
MQGYTLLTYVEEEFREQSLALSSAWDPDPTKRGPSLSLNHTIGASAEGGVDALLQPTTIQGLDGSSSNGHRFEAELAYGFPAGNDRLTLSPALALAFAPDSRTYGLLWSLAPYARQGQTEPWEIALEGSGRNLSPLLPRRSIPSSSPSPCCSKAKGERHRGNVIRQALGEKHFTLSCPTPLQRSPSGYEA